MSRADFIEECTLCDLPFDLYEAARPRVVGMLALKPQNIQQERDAILAVLNNERNIEQAIKRELPERDAQFFVVEREFWRAWMDNVNFKGDHSPFAVR